MASPKTSENLVEVKRHALERLVVKAVEALTLIAGHVSEELLLRNEYLAAENEILRSKLGARVELSNPERIRLAKLGKKLGRKALKGVSAIVKPETILSWYRELVARKFDSSQRPRKPGRPPTDNETEELVLKMAAENPTWGYDRIRGALMNVGQKISDQTIGNILERNGVPPAPRRKPEISWADFIKMHEDVLAACDFFTAEVLTAAGLITYYVLFVIKVESRDVHIAGVTSSPNEKWMKQIARNLTMMESGFLDRQRFLIHDRDTKFTAAFQAILRSSGIEPIKLPPSSPNLNAFAERWIRSAKSECLSKLLFFGEEGLRRALREYVEHYREGAQSSGPRQCATFSAGRASIERAE